MLVGAVLPGKLRAVGLIQSLWVGRCWMFLTTKGLAKSLVPEQAVRRCCLDFGFLFLTSCLVKKAQIAASPNVYIFKSVKIKRGLL